MQGKNRFANAWLQRRAVTAACRDGARLLVICSCSLVS